MDIAAKKYYALQQAPSAQPKRNGSKSGKAGAMSGETDAFLREVLSTVKTIAVAGASNKPSRPSYGVFRFLRAQGYRVIGVNPNLAGQTIHGAPVYGSLAEVPSPIDMVDIFRNPEAAGRVVDEALALAPRPKVIWMQLGVVNEAAAAKARAQGVKVVMDRCPKIEYQRLGMESLRPVPSHRP